MVKNQKHNSDLRTAAKVPLKRSDVGHLLGSKERENVIYGICLVVKSVKT